MLKTEFKSDSPLNVSPTRDGGTEADRLALALESMNKDLDRAHARREEFKTFRQTPTWGMIKYGVPRGFLASVHFAFGWIADILPADDGKSRTDEPLIRDNATTGQGGESANPRPMNTPLPQVAKPSLTTKPADTRPGYGIEKRTSPADKRDERIQEAATYLDYKKELCEGGAWPGEWDDLTQTCASYEENQKQLEFELMEMEKRSCNGTWDYSTSVCFPSRDELYSQWGNEYEMKCSRESGVWDEWTRTCKSSAYDGGYGAGTRGVAIGFEESACANSGGRWSNFGCSPSSSYYDERERELTPEYCERSGRRWDGYKCEG